MPCARRRELTREGPSWYSAPNEARSSRASAGKPRDDQNALALSTSQAAAARSQEQVTQLQIQLEEMRAQMERMRADHAAAQAAWSAQKGVDDDDDPYF